MRPLRLRVRSKETCLPILLKGEQWLVGRDPGCEVSLDDPTVSRRHALLYRRDGELWIRDAGARNETVVNDETLQGERQLQPGDRLLIGSTTIEIAATDDLRARIIREPTKTRSADTVAREMAAARPTDTTSEPGRLAGLLAPVVTPEDAAQLTLDVLAESVELRRAVVARLGPARSIQVLASRRNADQNSAAAASVEIGIPDRLIVLLRDAREPFHVPADGPTDFDVLLAPIRTHSETDNFLYVERRHVSDRRIGQDLDRLSWMARILASRLGSLYEIERLQRENTTLREQEWPGPKVHAFSPVWRELLAQVDLLHGKHNPVTILGEPGTGKCLIARRLHLGDGVSRPPATPLVIADCRAAPGADIESDLFGGTDRVLKRGWLAAAHGGTLALRHIECLPAKLQTRLVSALTNGETAAAAGRERLHVRLVATSTASAAELFAASGLVPSLATILANCTLEVPPLREHLEDLPGLVAVFLDEFGVRNGVDGASPRAMDCLRTYGWPGNVAELRDCLHAASTLAAGGQVRPKHLPRELREPASGDMPKPSSFQTLEAVEKEHIRRVLEAVGGNKVLAARILGIANSTLYEKLKRYEL